MAKPQQRSEIKQLFFEKYHNSDVYGVLFTADSFIWRGLLVFTLNCTLFAF